MSYVKRDVVQQKLNKAKNAVPNDERFRSNEEIVKEIEGRQAEIDKWNEDIKEVDPKFDDLTITGGYVIVRLFKENYIKRVLETLEDGTPIYEAYIGQVEIQRIGQNKRDWVENPLPFIFSGVVCAIGQDVQIEEAKKVKDAKEAGMEYTPLTVGNEVSLEWFDLQRNRYYTDKQKFDLIKDPREYSVDNYEGYVRIHYSQIESINNAK